MFSASNVKEVRVDDGGAFSSALIAKLVDIDNTRIHKTDDLVLRKAVFGLLEIVSALEARIEQLEGPEARALWRARFEADMAEPKPDMLRVGEE